MAKLKRRMPIVNDPLVPSREVAKNYVNRLLPGNLLDFDVMYVALKNKWPVLIEGPTGAGKSLMVEAFAAKQGMRYMSVSCNAGMDPTQFFGRVIPTDDGGFVWQDGVVTDFIRNGGVLLFNEINFLPERISTTLFPLFDYRRTITLLDHKGEVLKAHPDLLLVSDMNPDYRGTRQLNEAFRNRQKVQIRWDYDPAVEKKLIKSDTLRSCASKLRNNDAVTAPISTNMLMEFERHVIAFGLDFATENFTTRFPSGLDRKLVTEVFNLNRQTILQEISDVSLEELEEMAGDLEVAEPREEKKSSKATLKKSDGSEEIDWTQVHE